MSFFCPHSSVNSKLPKKTITKFGQKFKHADAMCVIGSLNEQLVEIIKRIYL